MAPPLKPDNLYTTIRVAKTFLDQLRVAAALSGLSHADFCEIILEPFVRTQIRRMLAGGVVEQDFKAVYNNSQRRRKARKDAP